MTKFWKREKKNCTEKIEILLNTENAMTGLVDRERKSHAIVALSNFSNELPNEVQLNIIEEALSTLKQEKRLNSNSLANEAQKFQNKYLARNKKKYILLTKLSIKYIDELQQVKSDEATIRFYGQRPSIFHRNERMEKELEYGIFGKKPLSWTHVGIEVSARCKHDAVNTAIDSLDFLRGLWNFFYSNRQRRYSSGKTAPISEILVGPTHTLHNETGELVIDTYWYEPSYYPLSISPLSLTEYDKLKETELFFRNQIRKATWSQYIKEAFIKYARALSEHDMPSTFLKLWSLLEHLTMISKNEGHDVVTKRACFFFKEKYKAYNKILLDTLREERNNVVHSGMELERSEQIAFQLNDYVRNLLGIEAKFAHDFESKNEFTKLMDAPQKKEDLERHIGKHTKNLALLDYVKKNFYNA